MSTAKIDGQAAVDAAIVEVIVPQLHTVIDELLDYAPNAPRELVIRAKQLLPSWASNSFEQKPLGRMQ